MAINALSHQAFFNSLLAESTTHYVQDNSVIFQLNNTQYLRLGLSYYSENGRHHYDGKIQLLEGDNQQDIKFSQALDLILTEHFAEITTASKETFKKRVLDSTDYINRAQQAVLKRRENQADQFINYEQNLSAGHSMHPAAKSCEPLNIEQQQAYLPEFAGEFSVHWFAVHKDQLAGQSIDIELKQLLQDLFKQSFADSIQTQWPLHGLDEQWLPLPMHPIQAQAWRDSKQAQTLAEQVKDLQLTSSGWQATSSSRSIYHPNLPWMLKVSLPIKLTNSLRLLSEQECQRGVQFSELLQTTAGKEMQQRLPNSYFIEEPAWASIQDKQGKVLDLPMVSFRENPFYQASKEKLTLDKADYYCLASINQASSEQPSKISLFISEYAKQKGYCYEHAALHWLSAFWDNVLSPICIARSDYGIVLLAHQQNILVKIQDNLPVAAAYRDCQGIGLTDLALTRFDEVLSEQGANYFMPAEELNPFHAYYIIGNTLLNTIANIAAFAEVSEQSLLNLSKDKLTQLAANHPQDDSFYQYLLHSDTLRWKRNFYCFLADFNEASLKDPSIIYCDINNPLKLNEQTQLTHKTLATGRQFCFADQQQEKSLLSFSVRELGKTLANVQVTNNAQCAEVNFQHTAHNQFKTDIELWWSIIEHCFYQTQAQQLTCNYYPQTALKLLEASETNRLSLQQFLDTAPLWRVPQPYFKEQARLVAETGIEHPSRPQTPVGKVYTRYFYHLKRQITFRVIDKQRDLDCFNLWHNHPIIYPVWELEGDKESHYQYLEKMEKDNHQYAVIGEFNGVPFGYFEVYWTPEDRLGPYYDYHDYDRGVHILVGNFNFRAGVYFDAWGCAILHYCFLDDKRTQNIMGEPRAENHRVVKITERLGLQKQFEFDFPHKRAALLKCERERFFNEFII